MPILLLKTTQEMPILLVKTTQEMSTLQLKRLNPVNPTTFTGWSNLGDPVFQSQNKRSTNM